MKGRMHYETIRRVWMRCYLAITRKQWCVRGFVGGNTDGGTLRTLRCEAVADGDSWIVRDRKRMVLGEWMLQM